MTLVKDIPPEIANRARVVMQMALNTDAIGAADILIPWVRNDPELFVQVMLAVALMCDPDKQLRDAHAAYGRGDRTPAVVEMERDYQRNRQRKTRRIKRERDDAAA